jgi:hypothetical protein
VTDLDKNWQTQMSGRDSSSFSTACIDVRFNFRTRLASTLERGSYLNAVPMVL